MALNCINSWKNILPEYEYKLWNEDNFDINSVPYVKEAYQVRKFAFVSDYVRLFALYHEGGVYMDTDVEVLKPLDNLLHLPAFSGFESDKELPTGIMASEKNGLWAGEMLEYYHENRHFIKPDGKLDMTTNVQIIGGIMSANGFVMKNSFQNYKNLIYIFPKDYFCPKDRSGKINLTPNTYCIHHFAGTWQPGSQKIKKFIFKKILGAGITALIVRLKWKLLGVFGIKKR